jgi:hypothetical protein
MSTYKPYLEFIRYSLNPETELSLYSANIDWEGLYHFASEQAILGVVFEGVKRLKEKGVKLPIKQFVTWIAAADDIAEQNKKINQAVLRLTTKLKEKGQQTCILKGQGNNLLYPNVYARTPGDIDIWVKHESISEKEYIGKVIQYVKKKNRRVKVSYHHIEIGKIDGIDVELHIRPSFMNSPIHNRRLQKWFNDHAEEQFSNVVDLPENVGSICVPTFDFNLIYMLQHMFRHLFSEGIGLRQMLDYYFLITKENRCVERTVIKEQLSYLGLWKFTRAVMYILQTVFGLEERLLIAEPDREEGEFLLNEILIGGNFGKYDTRLGSKENEGIWHRYFRMTVRNMRYVTHYPAEALFEPIFRSWKALNRLLRTL